MHANKKIESGGLGVAVVTGASAGLGRAIARTFGQNGYDVALLARGGDGLEQAKKEIESMGQRAACYQLDVADAEAVERVAARIEKELGPIEVWINNAMNSVFSPISEMEPAEYKRVAEVTYLGQVYGTLAALKHMLPRDRGKIILVGSALAYRGIPLQSAYCASKHAVKGFFDSLRTELLHDKSRVQATMVQLPAMNTTQFGFVKSRLPRKAKPMGKIYQPEVAAAAILYAAQHNRREINVGWSTLQAIVGNKLAPWFVDYVLARTGYEGQQTNEPEDPSRDNNLWEPLPGDYGAHGPFGSQATNFSFQLWLSLHRKDLLTVAAAAATVLLFSNWLRR